MGACLRESCEFVFIVNLLCDLCNCESVTMWCA